MNKYHESVNVLIPRPSHKGYHKGLTENYSRAQSFLFSEKNIVIWLKEIQIRRESSSEVTKLNSGRSRFFYSGKNPEQFFLLRTLLRLTPAGVKLLRHTFQGS